ncbi:MAG: hypothetical protein KatS3mg103_1081 [Phycisphaerales bacterium]|nr:MAG: hypothetical protein KatS3mg103_1081 [Phycisphaerales bacterium]
MVVEGRRREYDALQTGSTPIGVRSKVRIVSVDAPRNTLVVRLDEGDPAV